ncbi:hypothetical protein QE385_000109 [Sphingomonas sp. SORGH_AS 950]|uniref:hypothetical protein n=1 Tax=Sphingomonas sp. SORGH_AS_0950 TaxID=3041792 RepID=UPI0027895D4C|nr:hypothetical protein [Sphingomonas sp. SORGH_AS_0950]MDQ1155782.1 hypothetical protein [Sphingomonas sp. SORGH_AS_0950]
MRRGWAGLMLAAALAACGSGAGDADNAAGEQLEAASIAAGLVADPAVVPLEGMWARDSDRMCILPPGDGGSDASWRIGVMVDYGEGQGCTARGTLKRSGRDLAVTLGGCRFTARFDGDDIQFPATLPAPCASLCTGRASLSALIVERISRSVAEARTLRSADGAALCDD